ncbi:MAG: sigma-54-dependent Fis family transcriptional regulator [Gemmatimonadales bacterium]|nr:MAG: sigma-54-dependent Fis family transcriptional regulator [Gemmatimonadales bacterium]
MRILIVDDEGNIRRALGALLEAEGHKVETAGSAEEALVEVPGFSPDVILLDLMLPGRSGLEILPEIGELLPSSVVVMMSGQATLAHAVEATRLGAFHFIEKPLSPEAVLLTIKGAEEVVRARDLTRALQEELGPEAELVGRSPAMERVGELVRRAAPSDARILITGESGTGKELVATAIHGLSPRAGGPFIRVNSAAIPRDLVESEMFGHERGAFTGATERRRGRFELADGGTLFLDEVADLGPEAQGKLLRALETGVIERVGGAEPIEVDVRVVAATNRDLREAVREGTFRQDLLFRLEVLPIHLPPLRERSGDIPLLVEFALRRLQKRHGVRPARFTPEALELLSTGYDWPGNVRELLNVVERLSILHPDSRVDPGDVREVLPGLGMQVGAPAYLDHDRRPLRDRLDDYERSLVVGALEAAEGNITEAARRLRTDRANLYRRMKRLGMWKDEDTQWSGNP